MYTIKRVGEEDGLVLVGEGLSQEDFNREYLERGYRFLPESDPRYNKYMLYMGTNAVLIPPTTLATDEAGK